MSDAKRTEGEPHDRLTRLAGAVASALEASPDYRAGDKAIVMLDDGTRGGICLHGYDDDLQAMTDLLCHLKALFEASGKRLELGFGDSLMDAAVQALGTGGAP